MIRSKWKSLLGDSLERFLLIAGEILHEEELAIWMQLPSARRRMRSCRPGRRGQAAEEAARRRRERGDPAMALRGQPLRGPGLRRSGPRVREVQRRRRPGCPTPC